MRQIEQIRHQIMQNKRKSIFNLNLDGPADFLPPVKKDRNATIDSESNFSLFPLISAADESKQTRSPSDADWTDPRQLEKIQLRPFLKEKRQKRAEGSEREWRSRGRNDSVENVVSMMARSCVPSVRINRATEGQVRLCSRTERVLCVQNRDVRPACLKGKPKRSPSKSPSKRVRRVSRTRRTVSPIRMPGSPVRKFSISAWEIPGEESYFE